jgi:antibiotic biosynthesis monooxygenase (ABM) superfamily enzyme
MDQSTTTRHAILKHLKSLLIIWCTVYPSVLLVLCALGDRLQNVPLPLRVLAATAVIVPIVSYVTGPVVRSTVAAIERARERRRPSA